MQALAKRFQQMMSQNNLRITMSQLAELTGVSPSQLRYWEKKGFIHSEQGEKNQNHLFPIRMLYRVTTIKYFLDQGYTLANAVKKADAHRESAQLFRQFIADQQLQVTQTGPNQGEISIGTIAEDPSTEVYATIDGNKTALHLRKRGWFNVLAWLVVWYKWWVLSNIGRIAISLAEEGLSYSKLNSDAAKEAALKAFISFYVDQYRHNNLEILGAEVSNEVMSTINDVLHNNLYMAHDELVATSEWLSKSAYEEILDELTDLKFNAQGQPVVPFHELWQEREEALPTED